MWDKIVKNAEKIVKRKDFIFIIFSVIFAVIVSGIRIGADDAAVWAGSGNTPKTWFDWVYGAYYSWSSRVIINYIWAAILHSGKLVWMAYMGISMFVMLKAFELLFFTDDSKLNSLYAVCIMFLFPFHFLTSAGWIATSATYFGPLAFGMICLVPIRHAFEGKKEKMLPFLFYCGSLIYAGNEEQMIIVILAAYAAAMVYLSLKKKINWQIIILFVLSVLSLIFIATCPGNGNRSIAEQGRFYPTFDMLDIIDKADIGLSTTMKWLLIDNNLFLVFTLLIMSWCIWKKYSEIEYRLISLIPLAATLSFGIFRNFVTMLFPFTGFISNDIDFYGSFTAANDGSGAGVIQFAFFLMVLVCIIAELMLLNNKVEGFIADMVLVAAGTASRVMMGFSPTVYASGVRTFTPFIICIIAVSVHVWCENKDVICNDVKEAGIIKCMMGLLIIYGHVNLLFIVYNTFR